MEMAKMRAMLESRKGDLSIDDFAYDINLKVCPDPEGRMKPLTLKSYLNGRRNITGKGAKLLAQYFYLLHDFSMVDAISQVTLGIPYHPPTNGK